jgi:hypothetical protein
MSRSQVCGAAGADGQTGRQPDWQAGGRQVGGQKKKDNKETRRVAGEAWQVR